MKFLLDTHAALWFFNGNPALGRNTRDLIVQSYKEMCVSYVSVWETAIKKARGKLSLKRDLDVYVRKADFGLLNIELSHIHATMDLPLIHRDPFDRLLIAQSQSENMTLVTGDSKILKYPDVLLIDATK